MTVQTSDPEWQRSLSRSVLRLGRSRTTAVLSLGIVVVALVIVQLLMLYTGGNRELALVITAATASLLAPPVAWIFLGLLFQLESVRQRLDVLATRDHLTGLRNRRCFMELAEREWGRCRRYGTDAAVLLIDVDHFKRVNDNHGHLCGDALLREITRVSSTSLRQADVLARFGGEEFIVFLPHTDPLGALDVAERIRSEVSGLRMPWMGVTVATTVSVGVASLGADHGVFDALIQDADLALYAAKDAGRNCVRAAPIQPRRSGETYPVISK
jgi:diguanylate cyclase